MDRLTRNSDSVEQPCWPGGGGERALNSDPGDRFAPRAVGRGRGRCGTGVVVTSERCSAHCTVTRRQTRHITPSPPHLPAQTDTDIRSRLGNWHRTGNASAPAAHHAVWGLATTPDTPPVRSEAQTRLPLYIYEIADILTWTIFCCRKVNTSRAERQERRERKALVDQLLASYEKELEAR